MQLDPQLVQDLLRTAQRRGATAGDALLVDNESFEVQVRLGEVEKVQQSHQKRLGLRLFFGQRSATTSTADLSEASLRQLLDDTCALAQAMAEDPCAGLPDPAETVHTFPDLELWDEAIGQVPVEERTALARQAERAALDYDSRITNSEGGDYSCSQSHVLYANSHGLVGQYRAGSASLSVSSIASDASGMQNDYWYGTGRKFSQLPSPAAIGQEAARRALRRLGARKVPTQRVPVVFDPSMAASLLGNLCAAVSGSALYRGASFLTEALGTRIAPESVTIYDDGTLPGALGSKPFDGEGLPTRRTTVVERGMLRSYLLDTYTARKLGMRSTGNAARSAGEAPSVSPTNFYLVPGTYVPEDIIASVPCGLYVTSLIGFGVNQVTGDYSRGASGIWIENGALTYPVEEITIAGNLREMFANIEMIGNDLDMRRRVTAPTLKISTMMVAGS
ncbi:MAG: TldD/PmbA family protein [Candidatus Tectimicrobiota bacterium]